MVWVITPTATNCKGPKILDIFFQHSTAQARIMTDDKWYMYKTDPLSLDLRIHFIIRSHQPYFVLPMLNLVNFPCV